MEQRKEFVMLAEREGANVRELCRRQQISPTTGYKWLARAAAQAGLADQSRRPKHSPLRSSKALTAQIVAARQAHPKWGARKLKRWLEDRGVSSLPSASTVHAILQREGLLNPLERAAHQAWQRFEHAQPNDLWQMDFKGHFATAAQRCHPLTVLDDHSRYALCLQALGEERMAPTQQRLIAVFRRYGLPWRMTMDNGTPWGDPGGCYTRFEVWLMRLGIGVSHSRPYHPQTQGKDERFHRTLNVEVLQDQSFRDLQHAQRAFDQWLPIYNQERPHDALGLATPLSRYAASTRSYPEQLPALEYDMHDLVRQVQGKGEIHYQGHTYVLGQAFRGEAIALRRSASCEDTMEVYFGTHHIATITPKQNSITIEKTRPKA
jgi:transposase InsO family protein